MPSSSLRSQSATTWSECPASVLRAWTINAEIIKKVREPAYSGTRNYPVVRRRRPDSSSLVSECIRPRWNDWCMERRVIERTILALVGARSPAPGVSVITTTSKSCSAYAMSVKGGRHQKETCTYPSSTLSSFQYPYEAHPAA